jgi:transposase-like protein
MIYTNNHDGTLIEVFQACSEEGEDPVRILLRKTIQQALEEELTVFLKAEPYIRTKGRRGYRNGYKSRTLKTRFGWLELRVPKDREGRFHSELFRRYRRNEEALVQAVADLYVKGVSTRKVQLITEKLCGLKIPKSQVSSLAKNLDAEVRAWQMRPLRKGYPYVVVDARYEKGNCHTAMYPGSVLTVTGVDAGGNREVLGIWRADPENEATWSLVFRELKARRFAGFNYIFSDDHKGLTKAINRYFPGSAWKQCQMNFIRDMLGMVSKKDRNVIATFFSEITRSEFRESAKL